MDPVIQLPVSPARPALYWVAKRSQGGLTVSLFRGSSLSNLPPPPLAQRSRLPGAGAGTEQDGLVEGTAARRPVREQYRADQVAARHRSPDAGVAGVDPVVAE